MILQATILSEAQVLSTPAHEKNTLARDSARDELIKRRERWSCLPGSVMPRLSSARKARPPESSPPGHPAGYDNEAFIDAYRHAPPEPNGTA